MAWFFEHYVNGPGDLSRLPPLFVAAAELDPLLDDSRRLVQRLRAICAPHDWVLWPGAVHACIHMTRLLMPAEGSLRDVARWVARRSAPTGSEVAATS